MKRLFLMLVMACSFMGIYAADITSISNAFKGGNASGLASSMDKEVDIAVPGISRKCNASEAVSVLNGFFSGNKPSGFTVLHHADKKESGFFVGKLPVANGEFRVNITYRAEGNKAFIQSIRIE